MHQAFHRCSFGTRVSCVSKVSLVLARTDEQSCCEMKDILEAPPPTSDILHIGKWYIRDNVSMVNCISVLSHVLPLWWAVHTLVTSPVSYIRTFYVSSLANAVSWMFYHSEGLIALRLYACSHQAVYCAINGYHGVWSSRFCHLLYLCTSYTIAGKTVHSGRRERAWATSSIHMPFLRVLTGSCSLCSFWSYMAISSSRESTGSGVGRRTHITLQKCSALGSL